MHDGTGPDSDISAQQKTNQSLSNKPYGDGILKNMLWRLSKFGIGSMIEYLVGTYSTSFSLIFHFEPFVFNATVIKHVMIL